jgi:Domain of unknown function (DUF6265)
MARLTMGQAPTRRARAYDPAMPVPPLLHRAILAALCTAAALACRAQPAPTTADLAWLAGCWAAQPGEAGSGEAWMTPAGGTMLGMARTLRSGRVAQFEFMQLRDTQQGLVFIALPSGQKETHFAAERVDARGATFHNPNHDFPQRVVYELKDADTLEARIEGVRNGQTRTIRFPMSRRACPL